MRRMNVATLVTATLLLAQSMSAMAQEQAPPPVAEEPAPSASMPLPGLVASTNRVSCEVVQVDGNYLLVKLESGEVRVFNVSPERRFLVDGKPLTVHELRPGTILTATFTSKPPVGAPVATVTGKIWYASGNMVILTFPDGTNKSYKVPPSFKFTVNGESVPVDKLRKGMKVTAHRIPELPPMEMSHDVEVTGTTRK